MDSYGNSAAANSGAAATVSNTEPPTASGGLSIDSGPGALPDDAQPFTFCGANIDLKQADIPATERFRHTVQEADRPFVELGKDYDVVLDIGGEKISAHKELLMKHIPYFRGLFSHSFAESSSDMVPLVFDYCEFEPDCIRAIVRSYYDGHLDLSVDNVQGLLDAAVYLNVDTIVEACCRFMFARVRCDDVFSLLRRFHSVGCHALDDRLWRFIDANFVPITRTAEFKELTVEKLIEILQRDSLRVDSEQQVLEAVDRWMAVDRARYAEGARLLNYVRLASLPVRGIKQALESLDWVKADPVCVARLSEHKSPWRRTKRADRYCKDSAALLCMAYTGSRRRRRRHRRSLRVYNVLTNVWTVVPMPFTLPIDTPSVAVGRKIYYLGIGAPTRVLDTTTNGWSELAEMPGGAARWRAAVGVIDGVILVAGGVDDGRWRRGLATSSLIALDTNIDHPVWKELASMTYPRFYAASHVHNGMLYVFGGCADQGRGNVFTTDSERYNPTTDLWSGIAPMRCATYEHSAAAADHRILIVGGLESLHTFEAYTPATNTWASMPDLPEHTCDNYCIIVGGRLLATSNGIQLKVLDIEANIWKAPLAIGAGKTQASICWMTVPATTPLSLAAIEETWKSFDGAKRQ